MSKNLRKNTWSLNENYAEVEAGKIGYSDDAGGHKLYAWGFNEYAGQLGQNDVENRSSPVQIGSGTDWSKQCVSAGAPSNRPHCYAVKTNGSLYGWGKNGDGQLAQNNEVPYYSSPVQIPGTTWSTERGKLSPGGYGDIAAVKTDGSLWVWGANNYGKLGQNQPGNSGWRSSPVQIPGTYSWCSMSKADVGSFVKTNGELWMTGSVRSFLGEHVTIIGGHANRSSPCQLPGTNWRSTHWDQDGSAVLMTKTDGTLWFMGEYHHSCGGQGLPNTSFNNTFGNRCSSPIQVGTDTTWTTKITMMDKGVAAVKTDGSLWTWGNNSRGRLGHNDKYAQDVISPRQVGTDLNWEFVSVNQYTVAGTKQDGTMWMWGGGIHGLGQGYADDWESSKSSPVQVPGFGWSLGEQACQSSVRAVKSVN